MILWLYLIGLGGAGWSRMISIWEITIGTCHPSFYRLAQASSHTPRAVNIDKSHKHLVGGGEALLLVVPLTTVTSLVKLTVKVLGADRFQKVSMRGFSDRNDCLSFIWIVTRQSHPHPRAQLLNLPIHAFSSLPPGISVPTAEPQHWPWP